MWAAALIAAAFTADGPRAAVDDALDLIPARCRLARTVRRAVSLHDAGVGWAAVEHLGACDGVVEFSIAG